MACHCRRVVHPIVGRSVVCVSIFAEPFFTNLKAEIPKSHLFVDRVFFAAFISPSHEHVLERVARRHFGMGIFWDERVLPMLPGWDRAERWCPPPTDRHYAPPSPPPPPHPGHPKWDWKAGYYDTDQASAEHEAKTEKRAAKRAARPDAVIAALRALGLPATATLAQARKRYREGCLERHPDRGGSQEKMVAWNSAWDAVKNVL